MTAYRFKTQPYKHQLNALRKLIDNGYGGELFMEPRTGKSKVSIDFGSALCIRKRIDKMIVICPSRVMDTWVEQFHKHCPVLHHITVWDAKSRRLGPPPPVTKTFELHVVIVNYDAFATPGRRLRSGRRSKANGRFKTRDMLRKWMHSTDKKTLVVLDESHRIASPSGSAANMVVSLHRDADYRILATGTPVTKAKKAHDLYMQYKFADPTRFADVPTVDDFKNAFGRWIQASTRDGRGSYSKWIGERNQDILQKRIHQTGVVVRREDCFDLPPRTTELIQVPLRGSAKAYDDMAEEMVALIIKAREEHTVEASIKLVQGLRLRQLTGGVATTDEGKLIRIGREKLDALRPLLEAHAEHEEKLVIAAQFRADLAAIAKMAHNEFNLPIYRLQGGVPRDQAAQDLRDFERQEGAAVYIVQPQSGSEGIDLSSASHMVWYSLTPSWVKYTQMCDRIALSKNSTTFTYLLGKNTVDELLYEVLQTDGEVARAILDNPERLLRAP
jgi:SNF2 family DNA or RNA helicase